MVTNFEERVAVAQTSTIRGDGSRYFDKLAPSGDIESFSEEEKAKIYDLIDMAISYHKTKKAYAS